MVDSLSQSLADSSWLTVDPDTYRYFFSASAQVFAAIFAVVAVAFSIKVGEFDRKLADISREKRRKAAIYREHWKSDVLKKHYAGEYNYRLDEDLKSHVWNLDDRIINDIFESIQNRMDELIKGSPDPAAIGLPSKERYHLINIDIGRTKAAETRIANLKKGYSSSVIKSTAIAGMMTILSLVFLWLELFASPILILLGLVFCVSIGWIARIFISSFKST